MDDREYCYVDDSSYDNDDDERWMMEHSQQSQTNTFFTSSQTSVASTTLGDATSAKTGLKKQQSITTTVSTSVATKGTATGTTTKKAPKSDICMILDSAYVDSAFRNALCFAEFRSVDESVNTTVAATATAAAKTAAAAKAAASLASSDSNEQYRYMEVDTPVRNLVLWTTISSMSGETSSSSGSGNATAWTTAQITEVRPMAGVLFSCDLFIQSVLKSTDSFEFYHLGAHIKNLLVALGDANIPGLCYPAAPTAAITAGTSSRKDKRKHNNATAAPRLVLILVGLDAIVLKTQKKLIKDGINRSVTDLIENAIPYVLYELDVEVVRWKNLNETCNYLHTLTRVVARMGDSVNKQISEIEHIMKASKRKVPEHLSKNSAAVESFELRETWSAMLQMLPQLSTRRAQTLVDNVQFSNLKNTFDALNNPQLSEKEREGLLADCFNAVSDSAETAGGASDDALSPSTGQAGTATGRAKKKPKTTRLVKLALQVYKSLSRNIDANQALDD